MILKQVKALDCGANYSYAPPQVDALINLDDIQSVIPIDARGSGPFVMVRFKNGQTLTCIGVPSDFR